MRAPRTTGHEPATASSGFVRVEIPYPARQNGFLRPHRSETAPNTHLKMLAVASANPSMMPTIDAGAPSVPDKNSGTSGYTISLATSFSKLTIESNQTLREIPRIGDGSHAAFSEDWLGMRPPRTDSNKFLHVYFRI